MPNILKINKGSLIPIKTAPSLIKGEDMDHIERKIKQIIQNANIIKGRNPTIEELMQWTGRDKKSLLEVLKRLGKL